MNILSSVLRCKSWEDFMIKVGIIYFSATGATETLAQ